MAFKKGQSGNPSGTRNDRLWRDAVLAAARDSDNSGDLKMALKRLAGKLIKKADEEDLVALKEVGQRVDGSPDSHVNVEHSGSVTHDHEGISSTLGWLGDIRRADKVGENPKPVLN